MGSKPSPCWDKKHGHRLVEDEGVQFSSGTHRTGTALSKAHPESTAEPALGRDKTTDRAAGALAGAGTPPRKCTRTGEAQTLRGRFPCRNRRTGQCLLAENRLEGNKTTANSAWGDFHLPMIFLFSNCSTVNPCSIYNKEKIVHKIHLLDFNTYGDSTVDKS